MKKGKENEERRRLTRLITRLSRKDLDNVIYYLLGSDAERETAMKIICDIYPQSRLRCEAVER